MKIYVYCENSDEQTDVAAVKSETLNDAIMVLKKYYFNVKKDNVHELTFKDFNNNDTNIMIISDY